MWEMAAWGAVAVDRDDATAVAGLKDFDALFDVAGGGEEAVAQRWGWLADDGRYLSVSSQGDDIEFMMVQWDADGLEHLLQGVADGTFKGAHASCTRRSRSRRRSTTSTLTAGGADGARLPAGVDRARRARSPSDALTGCGCDGVATHCGSERTRHGATRQH